MSKDVIIDLINILDGRLKLSDIETMSDGVLKAVSELLMTWNEHVAHEQDKRALRKL